MGDLREVVPASHGVRASHEASSGPKGTCGGCGREDAALKCSRCRVAYYCDRECQLRDWGTHKPRCAARAAAAAEAAAAARFVPSEAALDWVYAARCGDRSELEALLAAEGADALALATDERGNTALHVAAANGHAELLSWLMSLAGGARVAELLAARNVSGNTPLHWACINDQESAVRALVDAGAPLHAQNSLLRTPLDEAAERHLYPICELLVARQATMADALQEGEAEPDF